MKRRFAFLLTLATLPLYSVSFGQWNPNTTSTTSSIARGGNVGIGLNSPSSAAKLHISSGGLSFPGAPILPLIRLENTPKTSTPTTIWDIDVSSNSRLMFKSNAQGGPITTEMYLDDTELKVYPNNLRVGDNAVRSSLGAIYNFSGSNGMDGTYVGFSGTTSAGGGLFSSTTNQGKTAIVGDQDGNLKFLTKPAGATNMSWYTDAWLTVQSDGDVQVTQRTKTKDLSVKNEVVFEGLNSSASDMSVLVTDANGKVKTRALPADIWDGDDTGTPQTLSFTGTTLGISQGNTVNLASLGVGDNLGNHTATMGLNMASNNINSVSRIFFDPFLNLSLVGSDLILDLAGGVMGINNSAPSGLYDLDVAGDIRANGFITSSDRRLKENIEPIQNALDKILAIEGVSYLKKKNQRPELGFIAQDIMEVLPEVVMGSEEEFYGVRYADVIPVLVEAMKEQQTEIESRNTQIEQLEARLTALENAILSGASDRGKASSNANSAAQLQVFPNPASDELTLGNLNGAAFIAITDSQGKQVSRIPTNQQDRQNLDISGFSNGIYYITTQGTDGVVISNSRFVKN